MLAQAVSAQAIRFARKDGTVSVTQEQIESEFTAVPGQGGQVVGVDLFDDESVHMLGDQLGNADPATVDTLWKKLGDALDTTATGTGVHWLRTWVKSDVALKDMALVLRVTADSPFKVYLNGKVLVATDTVPAIRSVAGIRADSLIVVSVPIVLHCDSTLDLIALRIDGPRSRSLRNTQFSMAIHPADVNYRMQRGMMHYGVFVGINVIIMVLSLVIAALEKQGQSWRLLAALSAVSALGTVCEVGSSMQLLGLPSLAITILHVFRVLLIPWSMFLLIMVLGSMGVEIRRKRRRLYIIGVVVVTLLGTIFLIAEWNGLATSKEGLALFDDRPWIIVPGLFMFLVYLVTILWFSIDVIRLGIRLLRNKGYARWVGGGAVASSVLSMLLNVISGATGLGMSSWFSVVGDYFEYAAVPVSVAVYLAIRSAHHNRLVERQRDDLDREVQERTAELRKERDRSDELLLNILPAEVAEELKTLGEAAARHFEEASVLFTDFKGFTTMAAQVDAAELLNELNTCFKAFDDIIDKRRIEKIKTIGDAYMCAGGLPHPGHATTADVVFAALEMQAFMQQRKVDREAEGRPAFDMRVGIHSGPVVAGIVGVKKFQYDIWGDTVNTASRMESSGEVGQVNISHETYLRVKDHAELRFTPRGLVQAKGKGEMEMYFVEYR